MAYENAILVIIIAGILLFGSKKLPEIFRSLGRAHTEYEKAKLEAQREFVRTDELDEYTSRRKNLEEIASILSIVDPASLSDKELRESIQKKIGPSRNRRMQSVERHNFLRISFRYKSCKPSRDFLAVPICCQKTDSNFII
jgi:sec-independent protein translocase protein TatA